MIREFHCGQLAVRVYPTRQEMGAAAARAVEDAAPTGVIFAAAPSQNDILASLRAGTKIDWPRVTAYHLDEYVGVAADHPASFRRFIRERLLDHVPVSRFHQLHGEAADPEAECARYAALVAQGRPELAILGIGENGHLAFIDPPVCDFADPRDVRVVELDEVCRMQQVHDGAFPRIEDVPRRALSVTIPLLMRTPRLVVVVPGPVKQRAVQAALEGEIGEACPASILRRHPNASLFLDSDSAALCRE